MQVERIKAAYKKGYRIIGNDVVYTPTGNVRKLQRDKIRRGLSAYPRFTIKYNKKPVKIFAHQLAAYQKYGEKKYSNSMITRHKIDNPENFSLGNIILGTQSENIMDKGLSHIRANMQKARAAKIRFNRKNYAVIGYD